MSMFVQKDSEAAFRPRRNDRGLRSISDVHHGQKWQHMYYIPALVFSFLTTFSFSFPSKYEKAEMSLKITNVFYITKFYKYTNSPYTFVYSSIDYT